MCACVRRGYDGRQNRGWQFGISFVTLWRYTAKPDFKGIG